jgi:hypothetical protein
MRLNPSGNKAHWKKEVFKISGLKITRCAGMVSGIARAYPVPGHIQLLLDVLRRICAAHKNRRTLFHLHQAAALLVLHHGLG